MSISIKVVFASLACAFLGSIIGDILQQQLIFSVYFADHITRRFTLSGSICLLLGATSGAILVLSKAKLNELAATFALVGAASSVVWLSTEKYSELFHWWKFRPENQHSFAYWNVARDPIHEFLANAFIFNGVPLLWLTLLVWWGVKQLKQPRKKSPIPPTERLTPITF